MELGNIAFGNSRGEFPVPRAEFEPDMFRLLDILHPESGIYGTDFENDVFSIMPYTWGDCSCGWDFLDKGHESVWALKHSPSCYWHEYDAIWKGKTFDHEAQVEQLKPIYEKHGWSTEGDVWWHGCAVKCTCDYHQRLEAIYERYAEEFGHLGCTPDCKLVKPNFLYKPTGFSISVYKYFLRNSYMSQDITLEQFREMIDDCIASLEVK